MAKVSINLAGVNFADVPVGTRLVPDEKGRLMILPPEDCNTEEAFNEWKDKLYDIAIQQGISKNNPQLNKGA